VPGAVRVTVNVWPAVMIIGESGALAPEGWVSQWTLCGAPDWLSWSTKLIVLLTPTTTVMLAGWKLSDWSAPTFCGITTVTGSAAPELELDADVADPDDELDAVDEEEEDEGEGDEDWEDTLLDGDVLTVDVVVLPPLSTWNSRTWAKKGFSTVPSEAVIVGVGLAIVTSQMFPFCTEEPPSVAPIELHIEVGTTAASCGSSGESAAPLLG
jgi:hypothetical protein